MGNKWNSTKYKRPYLRNFRKTVSKRWISQKRSIDILFCMKELEEKCDSKSKSFGHKSKLCFVDWRLWLGFPESLLSCEIFNPFWRLKDLDFRMLWAAFWSICKIDDKECEFKKLSSADDLQFYLVKEVVESLRWIWHYYWNFSSWTIHNSDHKGVLGRLVTWFGCSLNWKLFWI